MAVDIFIVCIGVCPGVAEAEADYQLVKDLHHESGMLDAYDTAVVERRADGKVKITRKHETPTRVGGVLGGGVGLATGLGAVAGHAAAGMSRNDLKELGEHLGTGQAGLVVVGVTEMESRIREAMRRAERVEATQLEADTQEIERDAKEAGVRPTSSRPLSWTAHRDEAR